GSSFLPATESPGMRAYLGAMRRRFPQVPADTARSDVVLGYRTAMETLRVARGRAHGDPGRLRAALSAVTTDLPGGPQRLHPAHCAVVSPAVVPLRRLQ